MSVLHDAVSAIAAAASEANIVFVFSFMVLFVFVYLTSRFLFRLNFGLEC